MGEHTKGPWIIDDVPLPRRGFVRIGWDVCNVPKGDIGKYYSVKQLNAKTRANIHLIAAAPELLVACQGVKVVIDADPTLHYLRDEPWFKRVKTAIRKAKGVNNDTESG